MVSTTFSTALWGMEGYIVTVECFSSKGLPGINIIGLADTAVKESIERINAVISSNALPPYRGNTTINLAPANIKKMGSSLDLPILIAILKQSLLKEIDVTDKCFIGELSLTGDLRPCNGILCMCLSAKAGGKKEIYIPKANASEASVVEGITVFPVDNIQQIIDHLLGTEKITPAVFNKESLLKSINYPIDFSHIKGQETAKRALEIAAAGGHNVLLIGPPGSGKSMLSKAFLGILPDMTFDEMIETTKLHSISGLIPPDTPLISTRPFRSPHHTMSMVGLAGGGSTPMPGEISLAHNGVLFLDELPEFEKRSLEVLRQPLEDKEISITRANGKVRFPSSFMLICAMNPCPCGYFGSDSHTCNCTPNAIERYLAKISGPLLDRIDIQIEVPAVSFEEITSKTSGDSTLEIQKRVNRARNIARERYKKIAITANANLNGKYTKEYCIYDKKAKFLFEIAFERMNLSARGYDRILRVSRTIADLDNSEIIEERHILEAIQLRSLDRKYF